MKNKSSNEPYWDFDSKWSPAIRKAGGYTMIPNLLANNMGYLGVTPTEFAVLVNIESCRWDGKRLPFPKVETLAERIGISSRAVTRNITSLQKKGLIHRKKRNNTSNVYSFESLTARLNQLAEQDKSGYRKRQQEAVEAEISDTVNPTPMSFKEYSPNEDEFNKNKIVIDHDTGEILYKEVNGIVEV